MRKRCVCSWDSKDDKDEQRRIFKGSKFQTSGAWYWTDRASALFFFFFRLTLGTVKVFFLRGWSKRSGGWVWQTAGEVRSKVRCAIKIAYWKSASLKTMRSETGSQWSFFERGVRWSWRFLRKVSRAACFCIFCRRAISSEVMPAWRKLQ